MADLIKILGIDPGFGRLGYSVISRDGNNYAVECMGCLETYSDTEYEQRLLSIGTDVEKIIFEKKPDIVALEKIYFTKNQKTALKVAEARGIIIYLATQNKIPLMEFTPLEVKTAVCGYGKADKKQVQTMVKMLLKLKEMPKYDDTTDALAIALTAFAYHKIGL
ncbi:MAG: crossover junction endodeoxyribonuclease RuvC [Patescibacteria group bacterium]